MPHRLPVRLLQRLGAAAGTGRALSVRNFRVYFFGSLVSVSGPWMQATGQAWLVLRLTNDPLALATVASLQFLPIMLLSLIGGAVADRFPRRPLLLLTQLLGAVQAIVIGLAVMTGHITIAEIYALATLLGIVNALDAPLRQAFVGELVHIEQLPNAIALSVMAQNLGRIVGPALGGIAIAAFGVSAAFFLNALTFSGLIAALLAIRTGELQPIALPAKQGVLVQVREGLGYAIRTPPIFVLLIATAFIGMFGQNFTTMVPLVARYLVHATAAEFGLLNSCLGTGSLLGALWLTLRGPPTLRRVLVSGFAFGVILVAIACVTDLWLSSVLFLLVGLAAVNFSASVNTALQVQAPPEMRGRFASMVNLLIVGSSPIGAMLTGAIATGGSVAMAIGFNGLMCVVGIGLTLAYHFRVRQRSLRSRSTQIDRKPGDGGDLEAQAAE